YYTKYVQGFIERRVVMSSLPLTSIALATSAPRKSHARALPNESTAAIPQFDAVWARMLELIDRARVSGAGPQDASLWHRYITWQRGRATRIVLHSLDDRILRDIGLERGDIDSFVYGIAGRKPHHAA